MNGASPGATLASVDPRGHRAALAAALVVVGVHIVVSWGYLSIPWGDNGRWLYEVDRVAHGAVPYRDVYWPFPPLGIWILGGLARLFGSDLTQIWCITAAIALAIAATYGAIVAWLVPARLAAPVAGAGMFLGVTFSQQQSAPLALGMYTPAVPVAVLCLLLQWLAFLRDWERPGIPSAVLVGALGGAGFLAKHDVWFASLVLAFAAGVFIPVARGRRVTRLIAAGGGFVVVAGVGMGTLAAMHGVGALPDIFTGFGQVAELYGVNFPNLASLTLEVSTFGLCLAAIGLLGRLTGLWHDRRSTLAIVGGAALTVAAAALWLWKADTIGRAMLVGGPPGLMTGFEGALRPVDPSALLRLRKNFGALRSQMLWHLIPLLMPLCVLVVAIIRRRAVRDGRRWRLLIILLVACVALRARRMISFTEWSELMLEPPVYVLALTVLWSAGEARATRAVHLACGLLVVFGVVAHRRIGHGFGSARVAASTVVTPHGTIRIESGLANKLDFVRSLVNKADPTGERPLFAFGYSAGFSYVLGRPSVGSITHGFRLSLYPSPDSAYRVVAAEKDRLILIDTRSAPRAVESTDFAPWRWQPKMVENHYFRIDRPLFERLEEGCEQVGASWNGPPSVSVFDCAVRKKE